MSEPAGPATVEEKRRLRSEMAARRRRVPADVARQAEERVARAVVREPVLRRANRVALYAASEGELPTRELFERLGDAGLVRLLPRVVGERLEWAAAHDWERLEPGRFGIREPRGVAEEPPGRGDVVLLPGLAFDVSGRRLGRGAGFYDRSFPPARRGALLVGLGFSFQVIAAVPHDSRDRRVDAIVTEGGWFWCRKEG